MDAKDNNARLYTSQIHRYFSAKFGKPAVLSLDDWLCIRKWKENGIPVEQVLDGIDQAFCLGDRAVTQLVECSSAVDEIWQYKLCS
jgi:hypothetical protein